MNFNKAEKLLYTFLICAIMEFAMAYYNYFFHTDAFLHEAFFLACIEFLPAFIVGFICEWYIISRLAKKIAQYLHKEHFEDRGIIFINESLIALGMIFIISIYGIILHDQNNQVFIFVFAENFLKNAVFGFPFFLIVVGPLSRKLVTMYYARNKAAQIWYNKNKQTK